MRKKIKKTRIMVFGVFDVLHKGHLNFFKQARKLAKNPYLIVSLGRDQNVQKIKGSLPVVSEAKRMLAVKKCPLVDKAILGGLNNHIPHILKERPSIIGLGYDQRRYIKRLKSLLRQKNLCVKICRLKPFKPRIYKSSLVRQRLVPFYFNYADWPASLCTFKKDCFDDAARQV